jgi:HD superfamily phosphodiesterase
MKKAKRVKFYEKYLVILNSFSTFVFLNNKMTKEILAKSSGQTLLEHSRLVSKFAVEIARQSMLDNDKELIDTIEIAALLHDIGKSTDF